MIEDANIVYIALSAALGARAELIIFLECTYTLHAACPLLCLLID